MADFNSRFNEIIVRHSGNDQSLASAIGVSKQSISAWRTGTRNPKRPHIVAIAHYFNVSIPWLMGFTDDEHSPDDTLSVISDNLGSDSPTAKKLHEIKEKYKSPMIEEMTHAMQRMTLKEQKKMIDVGKALFPNRFTDDAN